MLWCAVRAVDLKEALDTLQVRHRGGRGPVVGLETSQRLVAAAGAWVRDQSYDDGTCP